MKANGQHLKIRTATLLLFIMVLCCVLWRWRGDGTPVSGILPAPVVIEVKGDVPAPGIYLLDPDSADSLSALRMAGWAGECPGQNRRMEPGESLMVLSRGSEPRFTVGRMQAGVLLTLGLKIDLNRASVEELMLVPQMRPDIASAVVSRRETKPWESVEELMELQGIGPRTAERWAAFLEVIPPGKREERGPCDNSIPKDR